MANVFTNEWKAIGWCVLFTLVIVVGDSIASTMYGYRALYSLCVLCTPLLISVVIPKKTGGKLLAVLAACFVTILAETVVVALHLKVFGLNGVQ